MDRAEKQKAGIQVKPSELPEKEKADALDALVREILGRVGAGNAEMLGMLYRDRVDLPVYGQALLGLELHRLNNTVWRDEVLVMISQFIQRDPENQTIHLDLKNSGYWWNWYGSTVEAHAWYLKLLAAVKPADADTRGLVKYLVNPPEERPLLGIHTGHGLCDPGHRGVHESERRRCAGDRRWRF